MSALPSFFVVGAQKAGTTTLHDLLASLPEVDLPRIKETHFFSDDARWARGVAWYLGWFERAGERRVLGEVDPDYLFFEAAPRRMRQIVESPRIVVVLRDPLDRAHSHYRMSVRRGHETLPFDRALLDERRRLETGHSIALQHHSYLARSRYAEQVERYRETFGRDALLVLKFDDLFGASTARTTFERICSFIGATLPAGFTLDLQSNRAVDNRSETLARWLHRPPRTRRLARLLVPSSRARLRLGLWLDRWNRRPAPPPDPDWRARVPARILDEARAEIERIGRLAGLDLADWLARLGSRDSQRTQGRATT